MPLFCCSHPKPILWHGISFENLEKVKFGEKRNIPLLIKESGKNEQNFLYRGIEVEAKTGAAQVKWIQDD